MMKCLLCLCGLFAWSATFAEVAGIINAGSYVILVDSSGALSTVALPTNISINSVAMNSSGSSVIGGANLGNGSANWGALINPVGGVLPFSNNDAHVGAPYIAVAINKAGYALSVGQLSAASYGVAVNPLGIVTELTGYSIMPPSRTLEAVDMNDAGFGAIGGANTGGISGVTGYVLPPGSTVVQELINVTTFISVIDSASINNSNQIVFGGMFANSAFTQLYDVSGTLIANVVFPFGAASRINSVAIDEAGISLIGGFFATNALYASLVTPQGLLQALSGDPLPALGVINSVDRNLCGYGIIGGHDESALAAYAAFVDPLGAVSQIAGLPQGAMATINNVSINAWGTALIGGTPDGVNGYAAFVYPGGVIQPLPVVSGIGSISIRNFVPSTNLKGNNQIFAQFINDMTPEKACLFIPSLAAGKFEEALMSASPQRNAISLFAADNNLFLLSHTLSVHLRDHRHFRYHPYLRQGEQNALAKQNLDKISLIAQLEKKEPMADEDFCKPQEPVCMPLDRPFTLWSGAIGAQITQKEQHETPGFDPTVGGFILGLEKAFGEINQAGGGIAYLFTHVHEKEGAGFSNINQELLFLYASWANRYVYIDSALWAGIFQARQVRDIHLTGYHFRAESDLDGFQLSPHIELGYDKEKQIHGNQGWELILDPFAMADWVNAWQEQYEETGDGPFNIKEKGRYSSFLRAEAGLRFYEVIMWKSWYLTCLEKGSYVCKQPFHLGKVNAFLVGAPGSFTVETLSDTEHLGLIELAMMFEPANQRYPYGSISYQGEFGSSYQSNQLTLEVSWDF